MAKMMYPVLYTHSSFSMKSINASFLTYDFLEYN